MSDRGATRLSLRIALAVASWALPARADPPPLTLRDAIEFAMQHHPALRVAQTNERVAAAQIDAARIDELPRAGVSGELLRGTGNVLQGTVFPVTGIPSVTGPPMTPPRFDGGGWGTTLGLWGSWDATALPRRMVLVDAALAEQRSARSNTDARRLEIAYQAADAFVAAVEGHAWVHAIEATVARADVFATQVHTLVDQQLRPGADAARADAEVARAHIALARAQQEAAVRDARLAEALGVPAEHVTAVAGGLLDSLPPPRRSTDGEHPLVTSAGEAALAAELRARAAGYEYLPRVDLVAALWLRGSGYGTGSAANLGAAQGLVPDTANWAAGIVISWPVMEMFAVRARVRIESARAELAAARRAEIAIAIEGQMRGARAMLDGALAVSRNTAPALAAARASATQAEARYRAGLATAVDVADAQRVLAEAEIEDASARISVRRAMLLVARASGDLAPFLVETSAPVSSGAP